MKTEPTPNPRALRALAAALLATAVLALVPGCGGGSSAPPPPPPPPPVACTSPADCDDGNACTVETCDAGTCGFAYAPDLPAVLLGAGRAAARAATFTVPATSGSVIPRTDHTFCADGPDPLASPPRCTGEVDLPGLAGATFTPSAAGGTVAAAVPFRFADLVTRVFQTSGTIGSGSVAIDGNAACPGAAQTHAVLPVQVTFTVAADGALDAFASVDAVALAGATVGCVTGTLASRVAALVEGAGRDVIRAGLGRTLVAALEAQLCAGPPCPGGYAEVGGLCRESGLPAGDCLARPRGPQTGLLVPAACVP